MSRAIRVLLLFSLVATFAFSQTNKAPKPAPPKAAAPSVESSGTTHLPVRKVALYKNGIGYFEHAGRVRGNEDITVEFTTAQLNDVLNSLTVVDLGNGRVTGVRYNSVAPLEQRVRALHIPVGQPVSRADFLAALRGARVEVRGGTSAVGRILGVEAVQKTDKNNNTFTVSELTVVTDAGEIRNVELTPATSVRLLDRELSGDVDHYLSLLNSTRDNDLRRMTISTSGTGERQLFIGYLSEAPVWKTTYRVLLSDKPDSKPLLQGWAIVDNTTAEDWKDVELSLISGAPQSFIQDISSPYYVRRPVVALPKSFSLTPQTHGATLDEPEVVVGGVAGGIGGGVFVPKVAVPPPAPPPAPETTMEFRGRVEDKAVNNFSIATRNLQVDATAQNIGDLFEYDLSQKITIGRNQSALVPIVNAPVEAEKVTLWSDNAVAALRALWLRNTSGVTLDGGTFNVLEDDTFAGEGLLDPVKPTERRLISYAVDQGVHIVVEGKGEQDNDSNDDNDTDEATAAKFGSTVTHVKIAKGLMVITREHRKMRVYTVRDADVTPRTVIIEHPRGEDWKLEPGATAEETTDNAYRFRLKVEGGKTQQLTVREVKPESTEVRVASLTGDQVAYLVRDKVIDPETEKAFRRMLAQQDEVAAYDRRINEIQTDINAIVSDQGRLRENMKALKGSAEERLLLVRYTKQLNDQEDRLASLNKELADTRVKRAEANNILQSLAEAIALDKTL